MILRNPSGGKVRGLTTAASIWLTACIGASCGAGAWPIVLISAVLVAIVLAFGRTVEQAFERRFPQSDLDDGSGTQG